MSVNLWAGGAALGRRRAAFRRRAGTLAMLSLAGLLPAACGGMPATPFAGPDPADPSTRVPAVGYQSTIGSYTRQRPVDPAPWLEQNERVAPPSGQ